LRIGTGLLAAIFVVSISPALRAQNMLSPADKAVLAGEWRANAAKPDGACGRDAGAGDTTMVVEFALTGGTITLGDGSEGGGAYAIGAADSADNHIRIALKDSGELWFVRRPGGLLKSQSSEGVSPEVAGLTFKRCREPADRSPIKLSAAQIAVISSVMPPDHAIFVDARAAGGCKALDYQYLTLDLVGPMGFSLGRWNSAHLAEALADGKKPKLARDAVVNWTVDRAEAVPGGYRLTITELIPPNGARGDTSVITLAAPAGGKTAVPEWKRSFLRCPAAGLSAD
jgi:hypothetical protein